MIHPTTKRKAYEKFVDIAHEVGFRTDVRELRDLDRAKVARACIQAGPTFSERYQHEHNAAWYLTLWEQLGEPYEDELLAAWDRVNTAAVLLATLDCLGALPVSVLPRFRAFLRKEILDQVEVFGPIEHGGAVYRNQGGRLVAGLP